MQAILTKTLAATNHRPTRIKAVCARGSIILPADTTNAEHIRVAGELKTKFALEDLRRHGCLPTDNLWLRPTVCGQLPDGSTVHVYTT